MWLVCVVNAIGRSRSKKNVNKRKRVFLIRRKHEESIFHDVKTVRSISFSSRLAGVGRNHCPCQLFWLSSLRSGAVKTITNINKKNLFTSFGRLASVAITICHIWVRKTVWTASVEVKAKEKKFSYFIANNARKVEKTVGKLQRQINGQVKEKSMKSFSLLFASRDFLFVSLFFLSFRLTKL